jgi:putative DNA primase/helicase
LAYWEDEKYIGTFPVMLAKIENINRELVGLHRTYLTSHGQKAPVPKPKKFMSLHTGALTGAAIRLYEPASTLILGEGIETSLCGALCLGLPAWACRCDYGLATVKLPDSVREVIALVDNDESGAGQRASNKLAARMNQEGRQIKRLMPEQLGKDWLDVLTDEINQ